MTRLYTTLHNFTRFSQDFTYLCKRIQHLFENEQILQHYSQLHKYLHNSTKHFTKLYNLQHFIKRYQTLQKKIHKIQKPTKLAISSHYYTQLFQHTKYKALQTLTNTLHKTLQIPPQNFTKLYTTLQNSTQIYTT